MPQVIVGTEAIQSIKIGGAAPATPYLLTAVIPLPAGTNMPFGIRRGATPIQWWPTARQRIARTKTHDYWELCARIESGTDQLFEVDGLDEPQLVDFQEKRGPYGEPGNAPAVGINADAWALLNTPNALRLQFQVTGPTPETHEVSLTGGFGNDEIPQPGEATQPGKAWTGYLQQSGYHRWNGIVRTLYKHVPVVLGGQYGYLHIWGTVLCDTPEVQWIVNWHNGGFEERPQGVGQIPGGPGDWDTLPSPFGKNRSQDIVFSRVLVDGFTGIPPADGFAGAWTLTPQLMQGGNPADTVFFLNAVGAPAHAMVKQVNTSNANERNLLPIQWQRGFRFAVHPSSVTPYIKHVIGMADWKLYGGYGFTFAGVPDMSANPAIDLGPEATAARTSLQQLTPYQNEGSGGGGLTPVAPLWPGSHAAYGGQTGGIGMWPYNGMKAAWTATRDALDILYVEQLRIHSRIYGAQYGNISGFPVLAPDFATAGNAPWRHVDRRFQISSQIPQDIPFFFSTDNRTSRKVHLAAYNPGPVGTTQAQDSPGDPTSAPDWWAGGPITGGPIPLTQFEGVTLPVSIDLEHSQPPAVGDLAVPLILQIQGATTFNNTKSLTLHIEGTGEFDIAATEDLVITGPSSSVPAVQAVISSAKWKTITSLSITAKSGTLVATETLTVGRAAVGLADYHGSNSIISIDDQHAARYCEIDKALATLTHDPLAVLYVLMNAADSHLTQWEREGNAKRLFSQYNFGPGRGCPLVRDMAWHMDRICAAHAFWSARVPLGVVRQYWKNWLDTVANVFVNSQLPNFLWQSVSGKEFKDPPLGDSSFEEGQTVYWGLAGREYGYLGNGLAMVCNVFGSDYAALQNMLVLSTRGARDAIWMVTPALQPAVYDYCLHSIMHNQDGSIHSPGSPQDGTEIWTSYPNQAALPEANEASGCLLNPAVWPAVDDDRYVAEIAGDAIVGGTPLTLLNASSDTGGPTQVRLTINGGTTYNNSKRRTFRVKGTGPFGAFCDDARFVAEIAGNAIVVGTPLTLVNTTVGGGQARKLEVTLYGGNTFVSPDELKLTIVGTNKLDQAVTEVLLARGSGSIEQRWRTANLFKTVTSITPTSEVNARLATEFWRIGTPTKLLIVKGKGSSSQRFHTYQHFATVTEIVMLTTAEAARTSNPDQGTLVATELFRFGTTEVGLRQNSIEFPGLEVNPLHSQSYQIPYILGVMKYLCDLAGDSSAIDTCILRYCSTGGVPAADLTAAKTLIQTWGEYSGGPADRAEQWMPLLWALQNAGA